ncbi:MAG: sugar kinase [Planctomycetota bacterium]|nr:MAG: sugar kinase [Planctomycetota bacterium]REJ91550.1 MAG: sugar kinase [Planctomycetota bacterium]REK20517.1 MAG: sugar kinase [Planctomycetota bacterium]REK28271.1 MAG: sugar kinase [Planctomycetota bacterium]
MAETRYDVLCAGLIVADHVCAPIEKIPPAGQLEMTDRIDLTIGGCGSNVAVDLSRLGLRACVAGRVGNDALGRHVCQVLRDEGVASEHVIYSDTAQTSTTMVVNVKGEDRRFIHAAGANAEFTGQEIPPEAIQAARVFYVGGFGLNAALSGENAAVQFEAARAAGVLTVLDVVVGEEDVPGMLAPVLPHTDLFLPNTDEARLITGLADPVEQAEKFRSLGARCVVITCGQDGAVLVNDEASLRANAHAVNQVDPTGGGDAFVAGFLYGRLNGKGAEDCLRYGAALGASCVQSRGATTGVFRRDELEAFVADHPLSVGPA